MQTANTTLLVNRSDFSDVEMVQQPETELANAHIRVEIGPFALTANNITYMAVGDLIGYWKFFDPKAYGIDRPAMGRMPVWGYGSVVESKCADIEIGTRIYGFFPVAERIDLKPVHGTKTSFQDGTAHRTDLHSIYNTYTKIAADPSFVPELEALQPILRPLFTTSFLIDNFFAEEDFFGAEQIIIISASSKTALGTAFCLKQRGVRTIGLTSPGNVDFVKSTGFYDQTVAYDDVAQLKKGMKTALIDMAGNGDVNAALYRHFGAEIVHNCMVGKSHWEGAPPPKIQAGAPPIMFFAPDCAKTLLAKWGPAEFAQNLGAKWMPFCQSSRDWLSVETYQGEANLLANYHELLAGRASPALGQLFKL